MFVVDSCSNIICCDTCILSLTDGRMGLQRYKVFNCSMQVTFKKCRFQELISLMARLGCKKGLMKGALKYQNIFPLALC